MIKEKNFQTIQEKGTAIIEKEERLKLAKAQLTEVQAKLAAANHSLQQENKTTAEAPAQIEQKDM